MNALKSITRPFERAVRLTKHTLRAWRQRKDFNSVFVHRREVTKLPATLVLPLLSRGIKGKLSCPRELTIVLLHNYQSEPITEKSLRYVGIDNYVVVEMPSMHSWTNSRKIVELHRYLESGSCQTDYVLYLDSDDVVIRDHPAKAIDLLEESGCEMLISNTSFRGGYDLMPEVKQLADEIPGARESSQPYLNSGVYISRTSFLKELMAAAAGYVTDGDLSRAEYRKLKKEGQLAARLPEFPKAVGCDQVILRYLHPRFHPRMKIDYQSRLAVR